MKSLRRFVILNATSHRHLASVDELRVLDYIGCPIGIPELEEINKDLKKGKVIRRGDFLIFQITSPPGLMPPPPPKAAEAEKEVENV